jgi:hypothetical protein
VCSFFGRSNGDLYVWDVSETNARATLEGLAGVSLPGIPPLGVPIDCSSYTAPTTGRFPEPCTWTDPVTNNATFLGDTNANAIPDGVEQFTCPEPHSACWKLVARLGSGAVADEDVGFGPTTQKEWSDRNGNDNHWEPQKTSTVAASPLDALTNSVDGDLPNVRMALLDTTRNGTPVTAFTPQAFGPGGLCGDPTSCSSCPQGNTLNGTVSGDNPVNGMRSHGGNHWHFENGTDARFMPQPAIWVMEVAGGGQRVSIKDIGDASVGAYRGSFYSTTKIELQGQSSICCALCDCSTLGTAMSTTCDYGGAFGVGDPKAITLRDVNSPKDSPTAPLDTPSGRRSRGFALKAFNVINLETGQGFIVGDVRAGTIKFENGCLIGNAVTYDTNAGTACDTTAPCTTSHLCLENDGRILGDAESFTSIVGKNNSKIWGNIVAKQSACFKNDAQIEGIIMAGNTIEFNNNATIVNTSTSALGTPTDANKRVTAFIEASW